VSATVTAADVKALRDRTGAGMMDCKKALTEADGDLERAIEILRVQGQAKDAKLGDREATEGTVQSYIHANGRVGALVEVDCNTDFVSRNEDFTSFARDVALHVAAASPRYVSEADVPDDVRAGELRIFAQQAADRPENVRERIAEGKLRKWMADNVLLLQEHVNTDKHESQTIEELRAALSAKTGENVVIRRFERFEIGG